MGLKKASNAMAGSVKALGTASRNRASPTIAEAQSQGLGV